MYVGDSITHGYNAGSWRWAMHKIFVDNGIDYTPIGVNTGNSGGNFAGSGYGGSSFSNVHSSQSSARAYEIAGRKAGGRFGNSNIKNWLGQSTVKTDGTQYSGPTFTGSNTPDTFFLMIGTNDFLSENANIGSGGNLARVQGNMLGTRTTGDAWSGTGDMDVIIDSMKLSNPNASIVITTIPCWTDNRSNNNNAADFAAMSSYNEALAEWAAWKGGITLIDVNKGLVDVARTDKPGTAVRTMFSDGLHPNAQGELIIAGNMAKAMGYAGRSAGQIRKETSDLSVNFGKTPLITQETLTAKGFTATNVSLSGNSIHFSPAGTSTLTRNWETAQTLQNGYTVDFTLRFGDGNAGGWNNADHFSLSLGNGTLNVSESYIQWGTKVLYSTDMSSNTETLRVAYITGDAAHNLSAGYYIWLGDMLIGEAESPTGLTSSGITFSYSGGLESVVSGLALDGGFSYAPSTTGITGPLDPYLAQQNTPPDLSNKPGMIAWTTDTATVVGLTAGGVYNARNATSSYVVELTTSGANSTIYANSGNDGSANASHDLWVTIGTTLSAPTSWVAGHTSGTYYGNIHLRLSEGFKGTTTVFGAVNGTAVNGDIYLEFSSATANYNSFTGNAGQYASAIGTYLTNVNGDITMVFNAGNFASPVIGGAHYANNTAIAGKTDIYINGGTFQSNIYAGSLGKVGSTPGTATINAGTNLTVTGTDAILGKANGASWNWSTLCGGNINGSATINGGTVITLSDIAATTGAGSEHKVDKFAGIIDGSGAGTVNGTKQMVFSNYTAEFLGTLQNFDLLTAKKGTSISLSHLGGASTLEIEDSSRVVLNGVTDVTGELTVNGSGSLVLNGVNTPSSIIKNQGQIELDSTTIQGSTQFTLNQANLNLSLGNNLSILFDCSQFSGTGDLLFNGGTDSKLTLYNNLSLDGNWVLNGGTLELRNDFYLSANQMPGQITFDGGALRISVNLYNQLLNAGKLTEGDLAANRVILYGTASIDKQDDLNGYIRDGHYTLNVPQADMILQVNTNMGDIDGHPTDAHVISEVEMTVANSYTGATRIQENGVLSVIHDQALSNSSEIINNGDLRISGNQVNVFVLNNLSGTNLHATLNAASDLHLQNDKNTLYGGSFNSTKNVTIASDNGSALTLRSLTAENLSLEQGTLVLQSTSRVQGTLSISDDSMLTLQGEGTTLVAGAFQGEGGALALEKGQTIVLTRASDTPVKTDFTGSGLLLLQDTAALTLGKDGSLQSGLSLRLTGQNARLNIGETTQTVGALNGNGTLHLGDSGAGCLILQQEDGISSFAGVLDGKGTLVKAGRGALVLTASAPGTPDMVVREGELTLGKQNAAYGNIQVGDVLPQRAVRELSSPTLIVGVSQAFSSLQLASNATMTFGSDKTSPPSSPIRLTVSGDAALASGSTINMIIPSRSAQLYVQGQLTLGDSLNVNLVNNGSGETTEPLDSFLLMRADGGFFGEGGDELLNGTILKNWNITVKNALSLFYDTGEAYIDGNLLKADAIQKMENELISYALNDTALAGAHLVWSAGLRPDDSPLTSLLNSVLAHTEKGDLSAASRELAASAGSSVTTLLASQQNSLRQEQIRLRNRVATLGLSPLYVHEDTPDFNYWVQGNSGYHKLDAEGAFSGYTQTTWGGTVGFDINTSPAFTLGGAFTANYNKLSAEAAESASGHNDECFISLFGRYKSDEWTHTLLVSGGWNDARLDRSVSYSGGGYETRGSTSGSSFAALYEATYDFILNEEKTAFFQPVLNASIQTARLDSYEESGAGEAGLAVSGMKQTLGTVGAGFRLIDTRLFDTDMRAEFRTLISQNLGADAVKADVAYLANPNSLQTVRGAKEGSTGVQIGLGLDIPVSRNGAFFIDGDADLRSGSTSLNGNAGYRYSF